MGECGCAGMIENHIFEIGDKYILVEEYPHCDFCDMDTQIEITEITKDNLQIFTDDMELKVEKLSRWMDNEDKTEPFFINPMKIIGTTKQIVIDIEKVFENIWDLLEKKNKLIEGLENIKDNQWEKIREIFIKEFNNVMEERHS